MYEFTDEMNEISGFGGSYEQACRDMLKSGLIWLDEHPNANPMFSGYTGVYGLVKEDNEDAKALSKATTDCVDDCTGAMHHAVVSTILWIKTNSWDEYVKRMTCNYN